MTRLANLAGLLLLCTLLIITETIQRKEKKWRRKISQTKLDSLFQNCRLSSKKIASPWRHPMQWWGHYFPNFSCKFLNPNYLFWFEFLLFQSIRSEKPQGTSQKMVFCYQNCSDLLWEKNCSSDRENFWNSRLKAKNFQKIWYP